VLSHAQWVVDAWVPAESWVSDLGGLLHETSLIRGQRLVLDATGVLPIAAVPRLFIDGSRRKQS
jgi:hypothetical protein